MANLNAPRRGHRVTPGQYVMALLGFILAAVLSGVLAAGFFVPVVGAAGAAVKAIPASFDEIPSDIKVVEPSEESRMVDSEGKPMARFFSARRVVVTSEQMSDNIRKAVIAIEDKRFMDHHGIDPVRMVGAVFHNLTSNSTQGASTITQQLVKNSLMEQALQEGDLDLADEATEVSNERKLREVKYALTLESQMTKDEILTGYLNFAAFGPSVYGVEAASRAYFSIPASELTISQAALLAGIVQSPVEYDPLQHPEAAQERRNVVLKEMYDDGVITRAEYNEARALNVADMLKPEERINGCRAAGTMAYFCDYVIEEFLSDPAFGETRAERLTLLETGGLVLRTSISSHAQSAAWDAVTWRVPVGHPDGLNSAITAVVPQTGYILAMAQNTEYGEPTEEDPWKTQVSFNTYTGGGMGFQPGSTFKAFTLVQWFKEGHSIYETVGRNDRVFPSGSFKCDGVPFGTGTFNVGDLAGKDGPRQAQQAVNLSINQAFVDMATKVDYCKIFAGSHDLGVETVDGEAFSPNNPSQIIGGDQSVAPLLMASAFGTFANEGVRCAPIGLIEVADRHGEVIKRNEPSCERVLDATVARQVSTVLKTSGQNYGFEVGRPYAAKTGTTEHNANNWVVGFVPQLSAASWVGFSRESSKRGQDITVNGEWWPALYGETFVGPMWAMFMRNALDGAEVIDIPSVFVGNYQAPAAPRTEETTTTTTTTTTTAPPAIVPPPDPTPPVVPDPTPDPTPDPLPDCPEGVTDPGNPPVCKLPDPNNNG